jgi:hypothetical protein
VYVADLVGFFMGARRKYSSIMAPQEHVEIDVQATVDRLVSRNGLEVRKSESA